MEVGIDLTYEQKSRFSLFTGLLVMTGVLVTVRMAIVALWCVASDRSLHEHLGMELTLTLLGDAILLGLAASAVVLYMQRKDQRLTYEWVASSLSTYALATLVLLLLAAIVPNAMENGKPLDYLSVVTSHVVAVGTYVISFGLATFLAGVLLGRRHRRTRALLVTQLVLALMVWAFTAVQDVSSLFAVLSVLSWLASGVVLLLNIRRLNWVTTVTINKKIRLLWFTACGAFASFTLAMMHSVGQETTVTQAAEMFVHSGWVLPSIINFLGFVFFVRLFFAVLAALPNSGIVDRRSDEVTALSTLTRLIAETTDVDRLLATATDHALRVCRAHGAWCEIYEDGQVRIVATQLVNHDFVRSIHRIPELHTVCTGHNEPVLVESIADVLDIGVNHTGINAIITVPLTSDHRRTGTLVVFSTVEFGFEPDDLSLLTAFGDTIGVALDQARLIESALEKERMQKEFDVARDIQASLLPRSSPSSPSFDIDAVMIPAFEVGGDYYDYVRFGTGHYGAIIADVSGKGVPAALYMATLKGAVLAEMRSASGPADLLCRINTTLYGSVDRHTYITMTCVEFDDDCRTLRIARAGHTPIVVRTGSEVHTYTPPGMAIGIVPAAMFDGNIREQVVNVQAGDLCLLTTDGVNERRNEQYSEIGMEAVTHMLATTTARSATGVVQNMLQLLDEHAAGADPHDDITIVALFVRDGRQPEERA